MKCLEQIIEHCSASFGDYVDKNFTDLVTESLYHTNRLVLEARLSLFTVVYLIPLYLSCLTHRLLIFASRFVRETGYNLLGALVRCVKSKEVLLAHGETFAKHLSLGWF